MQSSYFDKLSMRTYLSSSPRLRRWFGVSRQAALEAAKLEKGSMEPNPEKVGTVTRDQLKEIAELKMPDLNANDVDAAINIIAGTARSMGLEVEG